jgi:hypothetical protein
LRSGAGVSTMSGGGGRGTSGFFGCSCMPGVVQRSDQSDIDDERP